MKYYSYITTSFVAFASFMGGIPSFAKAPIVPPANELNRPFGAYDEEAFLAPPKVYHPETWFHYIGGNVAKAGITADLEAIANAGIGGIQLFHGQFGGPWPEVSPQIACLSELWDDAVNHTAKESDRLGLRFTMQNCPGWAMAGGPWIEPSNAMRNIVWSRTDLEGGGAVNVELPLPQPTNEDWRDYREIAVIAFPTPQDNTNRALVPQSVKGNRENIAWADCFKGDGGGIGLQPSNSDNPNVVEVDFADPVVVRTIEFVGNSQFNHGRAYDLGLNVKVEGVMPDGSTKVLRDSAFPRLNWQDDGTLSLACSEVEGAKTFRITIENKHGISIRSIKLYSDARPNNWEAAAGFTLREIVRDGETPVQSASAFVDPSQILDISSSMDEDGNLKWNAPEGKWTVIRVGHVNSGMRNGPAPAEGTGWECDKLSESGPNVHFENYIGRIASEGGPAANGLLNGMLLDSWECKSQTWTNDMEAEFKRVAGYDLRKWLPALTGYVVGDHETTVRFLRDWRGTINDLFVNKFYGRMAALAKENNLAVVYETAAGDVFPADILEYYKYADVPMCEFWQPHTGDFVGSSNFKDIKPTRSAARMYGKPRVSAEAFTSFMLTWDERWDMLKEVANINTADGVTHFVFHTYTHNPQVGFLPPGTSFGSGIGTPFLRGQTWWRHMPAFTDYLSRCTYMLERGKPVSDVLWYLGDEINHKPDSEAPFPMGYKYDYCNPDALLNRLSVRDGMIVTPEGIEYRVLWLPDIPRMLPETLEKILSLVKRGATIVGNKPNGLATLKDPEDSQVRFDKAVKAIWGNSTGSEIRKVGKGKVLSGMSIGEALDKLEIAPDIKVGNGDVLWLHRKIDGADWYYICAPKGEGFNGTISFRNVGDSVETWDPLTGKITPTKTAIDNDRTMIDFDLPRAGACFVVFRKDGRPNAEVVDREKTNLKNIALGAWKISFPEGWGAPSSLDLPELKAWKDLDMPDEAKAFSGTANYISSFNVESLNKNTRFVLDLGRVEMIARVLVNGKLAGTLWTPPYAIDITDLVKDGENTLTVEVTSTWFNRLVYDARLPEPERKTWTISGPSKDSQLRDSGLLGPVELSSFEEK